MSDEDALLAAIIAHPDEDTPRLMYADWLDDHGQPDRAEFIRIQCAPDADEAAEERAAELEERNRAKWLVGFPQFSRVQWEFRRGFPEVLTVAGTIFLDRYASFTAVPWVRRLCLSEMNNTLVRDFLSRPWRRGWVELELQEDPRVGRGYGYHSRFAFAAVAYAAQMQQLRTLQFSLFTLSVEAVRELTESPYLGSLRELRLDGNPDSPMLAPLREKFGNRLVVELV
jgi:uncharacterized protein (TIGR02996 family)